VYEPKYSWHSITSRHFCILVYTMAGDAHERSEVLTIRVPRELGQRLAREARRQRRSRSAVARDLLAGSLGEGMERDLQSEARRQSLLVRDRKSETDTLKIVSDLADLRGWK